MSVSMTLDAVQRRTKTVTRRHVDTWQHLEAGDRLTLIEKGMGLPKGAKQVVVAEVEIVDVRVEPLHLARPWSEIRAEGLWDRARTVWDRADDGDSPGMWFCRFWLAGHGYKADVDPATVPVRRIEWRYLDEAAS
jgi:hypothetical protein